MACALHAPAGAPRAQGMRARAASLAGRQSGFLGAGIPGETATGATLYSAFAGVVAFGSWTVRASVLAP